MLIPKVGSALIERSTEREKGETGERGLVSLGNVSRTREAGTYIYEEGNGGGALGEEEGAGLS